MTVKQTRTIVNGMPQGLKGQELEVAIEAVLVGMGITTESATNEKDHSAIRNEYVQHVWPAAKDDVEELTGAVAPKPVKKATKKAAKKAAKKAVKKAAKKAAKRTGKDGKVIVAYPKPQGRTRVMFALVLAGASNEDGLAHIQKEFGKNAPTNTSSLGWVRSQLRNNPAHWNGKYGATSKLIKGVKANKECGKVNVKALAELLEANDDESDE